MQVKCVHDKGLAWSEFSKCWSSLLVVERQRQRCALH